jgi:hypothetical protein
MPRNVYHGRRGGKPRLAQAGGGLDVGRLIRELKAARAKTDDEHEDDDTEAAPERKCLSTSDSKDATRSVPSAPVDSARKGR